MAELENEIMEFETSLNQDSGLLLGKLVEAFKDLVANTTKKLFFFFTSLLIVYIAAMTLRTNESSALHS